MTEELSFQKEIMILYAKSSLLYLPAQKASSGLYSMEICVVLRLSLIILKVSFVGMT